MTVTMIIEAGTGGVQNYFWGPWTNILGIWINIWGAWTARATTRHELKVCLSWNSFEVRLGRCTWGGLNYPPYDMSIISLALLSVPVKRDNKIPQLDFWTGWYSKGLLLPNRANSDLIQFWLKYQMVTRLFSCTRLRSWIWHGCPRTRSSLTPSWMIFYLILMKIPNGHNINPDVLRTYNLIRHDSLTPNFLSLNFWFWFWFWFYIRHGIWHDIWHGCPQIPFQSDPKLFAATGVEIELQICITLANCNPAGV